MPGVRITEKINIKLACCADNIVYLAWLNVVGGYDYWAFQFNQVINDDIANDTYSTPYIEDFETAQATRELVNKDVQPWMQLGAENICKEDIYYSPLKPGLRGILHSPKVLMLMNPETWQADGAPVWQTVLVRIGSFKIIETRYDQSDISFIIDLPETNTQNQ